MQIFSAEILLNAKNARLIRVYDLKEKHHMLFEKFYTPLKRHKKRWIEVGLGCGKFIREIGERLGC